MLTIRTEQFTHLERMHRCALVRDAAAFLREYFADAAAETDAALIPGVGEQIENAIGYGLTTERQILVYLVAAWTLGHDFDQRFPQASRMLNFNAATPDSKRRWLTDWVPRQVEQTCAGRDEHELG